MIRSSIFALLLHLLEVRHGPALVEVGLGRRVEANAGYICKLSVDDILVVQLSDLVHVGNSLTESLIKSKHILQVKQEITTVKEGAAHNHDKYSFLKMVSLFK